MAAFIPDMTTRRQLRGYGLSAYHSRTVTQQLTPCDRQGRAYYYNLRDVIGAIRDYAARDRVKPSTQDKLATVLQALLDRLGNVTPVLFGAEETELSQMTRSLLHTMAQSDQQLAEIKALVAASQG